MKKKIKHGWGFKPFEIMYYDKWFHIGFFIICFDAYEYSLFSFSCDFDPVLVSVELFFKFFKVF